VRRDHALHHLALQHEMHVAHPIGEPGEMEKQRGGHVVGQVAHQPQPVAKRGEVELQRVGAVHRQALRREFREQARGEIPVDLDRLEPAHALEQQASERALARADLDQHVVRLRRDRVDDSRQHPPVVQEVLSEALTRPVRA
jgi:hypothetical protein